MNGRYPVCWCLTIAAFVTLCLFPGFADSSAMAQQPSGQPQKRVRPQASTRPQERARPPKFDPAEVNRIFFDKLSDAITGQRPQIGQLPVGSANSQPASPQQRPSSSNDSSSAGWSRLIGSSSLEDEIKRIRLRFNQSVTTPSAFRGGGYREASRNLTILASLFAVVSEYDQEIRWQDDATTARDILARTARSSQSGTVQIYNEAKQRVADLQDLMSGAGLVSPGVNRGAVEEGNENNWVVIANRTPLMTYAEEILGSLSEWTSTPESSKENADQIIRNAELLSVLGTIFVKNGMDDADDSDYVALSQSMTLAATEIKQPSMSG